MRLIEFLTIYLIAPALIAVFLPAGMLFVALAAFSGVGLLLLYLTRDFRWAELVEGTTRINWRIIVLTGAVSAVVGGVIIQRWHPEALFILPRERPGLMVMIALLYPILSVLPQELIYRPLYFLRYGHLLPGGQVGLVLNAALFAFGHLMYWSWTVALLTFCGGLLFAWAYQVQRSFALAIALHSVAGIVFFAVGMGVYFYSGNVVRPF